MKRRDVLAGLLPVAMAPLAEAQQPGKNYRIAIVDPTTPPSLMSERGASFWQVLFQELRRLGYEEGRNLKVERYSAEGREEIYPQLAKQVVATQPDLIFSTGEDGLFSVEVAAGRVPIIGLIDDPVRMSLSTSLSRPSANVTGVVSNVFVIAAKRIQMMRQVRPDASHVALLIPHRYWQYTGAMERMYQQQGVRLTCLCVPSP